MVYPLFVGMASHAQARAVARSVTQDLLQDGGIVATPSATGQQWDSPNGWAPLQWLAVAGLRRYGQMALAQGIACRWTLNVRHVYEASGRMLEKYDVASIGRPGGGGEYPTQDGFGWTNGVTRRLLTLYPASTDSRQCAVPEEHAARH
jgi:alpha,alpha-trehalase